MYLSKRKPTTKHVLITLEFYASGSYQSLVGQNVWIKVSQPSVSRAIMQVTSALNNSSVFKKYVQFPVTTEARDKMKEGFFSKFGIPGVIAGVGGTHVCIRKPSKQEEAYYSNKGYHSLNVIIVCDAEMNILYVDSAPGSVHDSVICRGHLQSNITSLLDELISSGEKNFLLGDSRYDISSTIMTPTSNAAADSPEEQNDNHVKTRNVVKRTIGVLKARFRCLLVARPMHYKPEMAAKIVSACCVIHNIANRCGLHVPELSKQEQNDELQKQQHREEASLTHAKAATTLPT